MNSVKLNLRLQRTATILAIIILTLAGIAAITGILLAFNYEPVAGNAYQSLAKIKNVITNGWLVISLHNWSGNGIIAVSLIQIIVLFLGRQFRRSWFTAWVSGILLTLSTIALGWTAMILPWNQLGYWRLKVELGTIGTIPLVGSILRNILTGGGGINTTTIVHFSTIHSYVLGIIAIALSVIHLLSLIAQEQKQKYLILQQLENLVTSSPDKQTVTTENINNEF